MILRYAAAFADYVAAAAAHFSLFRRRWLYFSLRAMILPSSTFYVTALLFIFLMLLMPLMFATFYVIFISLSV